MGIETQRQWSDLAIERTTPCLFGLYSLIALLGQNLYPNGNVPLQRTAWYRKQKVTFRDVFIAVRQHLWGDFSSSTSPQNPNIILLLRSDLVRLLPALQLKMGKVQVSFGQLSRRGFCDDNNVYDV